VKTKGSGLFDVQQSHQRGLVSPEGTVPMAFTLHCTPETDASKRLVDRIGLGT